MKAMACDAGIIRGVSSARSDRKPKTHRIDEAYWWVEADGSIVMRSLGGGSPRRVSREDLNALLAVLDDSLDPAELDASLLRDCWFIQIRSQPCVLFSLPQASGRGNQDTGAHALLRRRVIQAMMAELR